jgi:hypothetical protein
MNMYFVTYYIRNRYLYTFKIVHADTPQKAIKKARVKHIIDIKEIKGNVHN